MEYIRFKDCTLEATRLQCPACQKALLKKLVGKNLNKADFDYYLFCSDVKCSFLGSVSVNQVKNIFDQIYLYNLKSADFTVDYVSGYDPLLVNFKVSCFGLSFTECVWDFGDGTGMTVNQEDVSHIYNKPGQYSVGLTVFDITDKQSYTCYKDGLITVHKYMAPTAKFTATPTQADNSAEVQFSDYSTGTNIVAWNWDFGDGDTSYEQNPKHRYTKPGAYTVKLVVINDKQNSATETKNNYINIRLTAPKADFIQSKVDGYAPLTVQFEYSLANLYFPDSFLWNFGDGTTSTERNPIHTYTNAGSYDVQLEVGNSLGKDAIRKGNAVTVFTPTIV